MFILFPIIRLTRACSACTQLQYVHAFHFTGFGSNPDGTGNYEYYIALPYLANIGSTANTWMPSIMDQIRDSQGPAAFGGTANQGPNPFGG